jgi:hypothetical protein
LIIMQPITRETIVDRRQPAIRWSAIFAGTAVAVGVWILLQVFGMGAGLSAIDTDNAGSLRGVGIGTSVWSLLAPLVAMFIGGWIAGKLAATRDDRVGGLHGVVVWALTSVAGVMLAVSLISAIVPRTVAVESYDSTPTSDTYDRDYHPLAPTHQQLKTADRTGKALLAAGTSLLLSLGTGLLGGLLAVRGFGRPEGGHKRRRGDRDTHTTLQTPVVPPPPMDTAV